jgi:hypothetical protein
MGKSVTCVSDSYLGIAERVLERARRPLSTQEIMREAYLHDLVPPHLHGKTQHKTLGARLSVDILRRREASPFFRPRAGRFFLRMFIADDKLPVEYRTPIVAKRRERELSKDWIAVVPKSALPPSRDGECHRLKVEECRTLFQAGHVEYRKPHDVDENTDAVLHSFVIVTKGSCALSYRKGRYIEGRDGFTNKQTIGFTTPIAREDATLFDYADHGAVEAGLSALAIDLDFEFTPEFAKFEDEAELSFWMMVPQHGGPAAFLAIVKAKSPPEFEPTAKRLAFNDLRWIDLRTLNNIDDFDPWSRSLIACYRGDMIDR